MVKIHKMYLDETARGRPGKKIIPKGLVIHWTANTKSGSDADNNRNYFNNSGVAASAHYIVDDHQIIQCLPENEMGYHVGAKKYKSRACRELSDYPNDCTIGIEICVNQDGEFTKTMENAVALAAEICKRNGWTTENIWRHYDITGKDCPRFFVDDATAVAYGFLSANAGWSKFLADVEAAAMGGETRKVVQASKWKQQIMERAKEEGLITGDHLPDDIAPKWFVLSVALRLLDKMKEE